MNLTGFGNQMIKPKSAKIFVDMDGVLSDFNHGIEAYTHHEVVSYDQIDEELWLELHDSKDFFSTLPIMNDAKILWNYLTAAFPKENISILSSTGSNNPSNVRWQKIKWIKNNIDKDVWVNTVQRSADKKNFVDQYKDSILIDDRMKSIKPWRDAGGVGILHSTAADTIDQIDGLFLLSFFS